MTNDYETVYMGKAIEIEKQMKVCMSCIDMVVKDNPQNPNSPIGVLVAPSLEILKVMQVREHIEVHWLCQQCGRIRTIDIYDTFDQMYASMKAFADKDMQLSNTARAVLLLLEEKQYEKLPGYTASIAQGIVTNRK